MIALVFISIALTLQRDEASNECDANDAGSPNFMVNYHKKKQYLHRSFPNFMQQTQCVFEFQQIAAQQINDLTILSIFRWWFQQS